MPAPHFRARANTAAFGQVTREKRKALRGAVEQWGEAVILRAELAMQESKSGRVYNLGGVRHQASAPGEAPAVQPAVRPVQEGQADALIESSAFRMVGPLTGEVSYDAGHAIPLEFGTSRMAPRPFLGPAVAESIGEGVELIRKAMQ